MKPVSLHRPQLLNALWALHDVKNHLSDADIATLAALFDISRVEVEGVASFYHFFHRQPAGKHTIYLNKSIVSEFQGFQEVRAAFEAETGTRFGHTDESGQFGFFETACIGLSDQEPAALIDFYPFTRLNPEKVRKIIAGIKSGASVASLADTPEDNIRYTPGDDRTLLLGPYEPGASLRNLLQLEPADVIRQIKESGLSGMGGAFFPTALKWESCRNSRSSRKFIVCNADEGEPGTFKDRVLLNRLPGLVIEGMALAAYATGASEGVLYLRAEYRYLKEKLEAAIEEFRQQGLLGDQIPALQPFSFDIRVQLGAGAYVCGEETALLNSMEGLRGEPRTKLYFPTERGYLEKPTVVNNVETFACAARIIEKGPRHLLHLGTPESPGTKLISVSGDCDSPGIYEIEWGMPLGELLALCGARDPHLVQVSGPSGKMVPAADGQRRISRRDLPCNGSFMVFSKDRDLLQILKNFSDFFKHESCGICTPCRAGNFILNRKLEKLQLGLGSQYDLDELQQWGQTIREASRCGLGQTAPNSISDAIRQFPGYFDARVDKSGSDLQRGFDLEAAEREYREITSLKK